jgi:opacity protein-like surface antigen
MARVALAAFFGFVIHATPSAGQPQTAAPQVSTHPSERIGVQGFGTVGINWQIANDSFDAVDLSSTPVEFGGGALVSGIWRYLFVQVTASGWSDTGERAFVDSSGNRFPLGIPLEARATFVDVSTGWKFDMAPGKSNSNVLPYFGGGVGLARYKEESPFAQPGDNVDERKISYHVIGGAEVRLMKWVAVSFDARYRYVPNLLGDDGVSGELDENDFGGLQAGVALRIGFWGTRTPGRRAPAREPSRPQPPPVKTVPGAETLESATIITATPAYLYPDPRRTPLRILEAGTAVRILEETGDWFRIEFSDPRFGRRIGYVARKDVQVRKR